MLVFTENPAIFKISVLKRLIYAYLVDDPEKIDKGQACVEAAQRSSNTEFPIWGFFLAFPKQGKQQNGTPKIDIRTFDILPNKQIACKFCD